MPTEPILQQITTADTLGGLAQAIDRACAEMDRLRADRAELLKALKAVIDQFATGGFVRNPDDDGSPDWLLGSPLCVLARAKQLVEDIEARS